MQPGSVVQSVFFLLLVFVAIRAVLARRLKISYPILLVIAGLVLSFMPGTPRIVRDPNLVFLCNGRTRYQLSDSAWRCSRIRRGGALQFWRRFTWASCAAPAVG